MFFRGFRTGGWKSYYTLDVSSTGSKKLAGNIKVVVHYFEDGNVQLHTDMEQSQDVSVGDAEATGKAVAKAISNMESSFQSNLEEMYVSEILRHLQPYYTITVTCFISFILGTLTCTAVLSNLCADSSPSTANL